jgi:hypothetical protein
MVRASLWVQEKKSLLAGTEDGKGASSILLLKQNLSNDNLSDSIRKKLNGAKAYEEKRVYFKKYLT